MYHNNRDDIILPTHSENVNNTRTETRQWHFVKETTSAIEISHKNSKILPKDYFKWIQGASSTKENKLMRKYSISPMRGWSKP